MRTFVSATLAALPLARLVLADHPVYTGSAFQEETYGLFPTQSYESTDQIAPIFQVNTAATKDADSASHVFISPRGTAVTQSAPMVFNTDDLTLVWSNSSFGQTFGVRVQEYNNTDYITFWTGTIKAAGYGSGSYIMLDSNYNVAFNLTTQNLTVGGDIHEIQLTRNGTALMTAYDPISFDLTDYNIDNGYIAESMFQEVDIATNDLIFSWRASDHFSLNDSYADPGSTGTSTDDPYDFFHINSIEKDDSGNYLVSSRHLHMITYINGTDGEVIWKLGGKNNEFNDLSGGNATNFAWQHDVRWQKGDLTELTLFDNGAADWVTTENKTRGLWLSLNYDDMSVTLNHSYVSPEGISSVSQGSVQPLSNGNIFMGYGSTGAFIEYSHDGDVVWDVQFGIVGDKSVQSYRAYKQNWTGYPSWNPSIAASGNATDNTTVYMSWNGATEIKTWAVLASNTSTELSNSTSLWKNVTRSGYETNVTVGTGARYIRAAALNSDGEVLGATDVIDVKDGSVTSSPQSVDIGTGTASGSTNSSGNSTSGDNKKNDAMGGGHVSASLALSAVLTVVFFVGL